MPIVCWGNLAKSASDTQRIEQSMQAYVEGHDENPNAHMGADYSLGAHRLSTELDHTQGSVLLKHLASDSMLLLTCFESLDGFELGGNNEGLTFNRRFYTNATTDTTAFIACLDFFGIFPLIWSKDPFFQTSAAFGINTSQLSYILIGIPPYYGTDDYAGFKISNGTLYACWSSGGVVHTSEISGITLTDLNVYRVECDSAVSKIYFYINGILKYTSTSDYPIQNLSYFFSAWIQTKANAERSIYLTDALFSQKR